MIVHVRSAPVNDAPGLETKEGKTVTEVTSEVMFVLLLLSFFLRDRGARLVVLPHLFRVVDFHRTIFGLIGAVRWPTDYRYELSHEGFGTAIGASVVAKFGVAHAPKAEVLSTGALALGGSEAGLEAYGAFGDIICLHRLYVILVQHESVFFAGWTRRNCGA